MVLFLSVTDLPRIQRCPQPYAAKNLIMHLFVGYLGTYMVLFLYQREAQLTSSVSQVNGTKDRTIANSQ